MRIEDIRAFEYFAFNKLPITNVEGKVVSETVDTYGYIINIYDDDTYSIWNKSKFRPQYEERVDLIHFHIDDYCRQFVSISSVAKELALLDIVDAKKLFQAEKLYNQFINEGGYLM